MGALACALTGAIAVDIYHSATSSVVAKPSQNELNITENARCIQAGMKPVLEKGKVICSPDQGLQTLREFWDSELAEKVIKEKLKQEGYQPKAEVKWPAKPVNNSFEAKAKVTE